MSADRPRPIVLEIARIGLEIRPSDPEIQMVAQPAHIPFLTPTPGADCASVLLGPTPYRVARLRAANKLTSDLGCIWRLEECGDGRLLTFRSPIFGADPYLLVEFDRDYSFGQGETILGGPHLAEGKMYPFVHPFDEVVFLARLSRGRGVLVHACGVSVQGRGLLFLGTAGSGKSTMACIWRGRRGVSVLSDDRIVVRADGSGYRIFGTPWHTDCECEPPGSVPLEAIFILEQAPRNRILDLPQSSVVGQFMVRSFAAMWDHEGLDFAVQFLTDISRRVPVRRLQFLADDSAVDFVLSTLSGSEENEKKRRR